MNGKREKRLIDEFVLEASEVPQPERFRAPDTKPQDLPSGKAILNITSSGRVPFLMAAIERFVGYPTQVNGAKIEEQLSALVGTNDARENYLANLDATYDVQRCHQQGKDALEKLIAEMLRTSVDLDVEDYAALCDSLSRCTDSLTVVKAALALIERKSAKNCLHPNARRFLHAVVAEFDADRWLSLDKEVRAMRSRINRLVENDGAIPVLGGEPWTDAALADVGAMNAAQRHAWRDLIDHGHQVSGNKPSGKWCKLALQHIEVIGRPAFKDCIGRWFVLVAVPPENLRIWVNMYSTFRLQNQDALSALVWAVRALDDDSLIGPLTHLGEVCFRRVSGPLCAPLGNMVAHALSQMSSATTVGSLIRMKMRVKRPFFRKPIETALRKAAESRGLSPIDLEELGVPTYGLTEVGRMEIHFGPEVRATVEAVGTDDISTRWHVSGTKKSQKSPPASIKATHKDELKALKQAEKDVGQMLVAVRDRLERSYLEPREWSLVDWRKRFLDHPLSGCVARRLIWRLIAVGSKESTGCWLQDRLVDRHGKSIDWLNDQTRVSLWHPLHAKQDEVIAWRTWLESNLISQPFKQAHREIYVLTDAERATQVYSNRFAAHIVRAGQLRALAHSRGWRAAVAGIWDSGGDVNPLIKLPHFNLRAEFWVNATGDQADPQTGFMNLLATDQVRVCPLNGAEPVELEALPPVVLSEIMRDVDLFVGVASIGNDPNWQDGGRETRYADYWQSYSFGDLGATAKTRKAVLEKLIPRLKIAPRCSFDDKFLIVRGELRTYKIHLGSGNILMEPNDQYLCIVAAPGARGAATGKADGAGVFLPFDGDERLSIILSKALMLADDTKIKDETITRQIEGK